MIDKLLGPVNYYKNMSGKNTRKYIIEYIGIKYNIENAIIKMVIDIVDDIHNASLIIDDIEDDSKTRRKNITAHIKYGLPLALNSGYLEIFRVLSRLDNLEIQKIVINNIYFLHIGQGLDIYYTNNKFIPTDSEYLTMIYYKTGILFKMCLDIFSLYNEGIKNDYEELIIIFKKFSYFYQIRDDYINLTDNEYWKEKGFCEDFDEQKVSYIIVYYINNKLENYELLLGYLKESKNNKECKIKLLKFLNNSGIFNLIYCKLNILLIDLKEFFEIDILFKLLHIKKFNLDNELKLYNSIIL